MIVIDKYRHWLDVLKMAEDRYDSLNDSYVDDYS